MMHDISYVAYMHAARAARLQADDSRRPRRTPRSQRRSGGGLRRLRAAVRR